MRKVLPINYSAGIGAAAGAYALSSDNDILAMSTGAAIGGAVGALGQFTVPSYENMIANSQGLKMAEQTGSSMSIQKMRESLIARANTVANSKVGSFSDVFNASQPFSSLNKGSVNDFSAHVLNTSDITELRRMSIALSQRSDSVGINGQDIKFSGTQLSRGVKMHENSNETVRENTFKEYLRSSMGYVDDKDIDGKYQKFRTLLNKEGAHYIKDDVLTIAGMEPIKLYGVIGSGENALKGHVSNNNVYIANAMNPFGLATLNGSSVEATASALGIEMADKFNLQSLLETTAGMTPDDVIAMAANSKNISEENLNVIIKAANERASHDQVLTGELLKKGRQGIEPSSYHRNVQSRTDYNLAFNIDKESNVLDPTKPLRALGSTARLGEKSEVTTLSRKLAARHSDTNLKLGVKPDFATQFVDSNRPRNMINIESPGARNASASVRDVSSKPLVRSNLDDAMTRMVKDLNLDTQYGDSLVIPRLTVDIEKYNPIVSRIMGSDHTLADGFSISNKRVTSNYEINQASKVSIAPNADGNYGLHNKTLASILRGEQTLEGANTHIREYEGITAKDIRNSAIGKGSKALDAHPVIQKLQEELSGINDKKERKAITDFYVQEKIIAWQMDRDLTFLPEQTVGYAPDGSPLKVNKQMDKYRVSDLAFVSDGAKEPELMITLDGKSNLGSSHIAKLFGVDSKTQIRNIAKTEAFVKAGLIAELINKGTLDYVDGEIVSSRGVGTKELRELFQQPLSTLLQDNLFSDDHSHYNKLSTKLRDEIGIITDIGDTGLSSVAKLESAIKTGVNSGIVDDKVFSLLTSSTQVTDNHRAIANLGVALTSSKASSSMVLSSLLNYQTQLSTRLSNLKVGDYTNPVLAELEAIGMDTKTYKYSKSPKVAKKNYDKLVASFNANYSTFSKDLVSHFNDPVKKLRTMNETPEKYHSFLNVFGANMDSTSYAFTSPSLNLTGVLGSESTTNSMSANAQSQLLYSGLDKEDLKLFGRHNQAKINDLHAIISIKELQRESINGNIAGVDGEVLHRAIVSSSDTRRENLKSLGIDIKGNYGSYNLSQEINGFKSVPIPLEESSIFPSYYSSSQRKLQNPKSIGLASNIIALDRKMQETKDPALKEEYLTQLKEKVTSLEEEYKGHLFSKTDPLPKAATRLEARNTLQSNVSATAGVMDDFIANRLAEGKHQSFGQVTLGGALERLKLSGVNVENMDDLLNNHTEVITSGGVKVRRLMMSANQPFYSLTNREPATGPGSIRMMEYLVDLNADASDKSLRVSWADKLYKYLQFGDHDADNMAEFFPDFKNKTATRSVYDKLTPMTEQLSTLVDYGSQLGVKGGNKDYMQGITDLFRGGDYSRASADYFERFQIENEQAGLRKRIAPTATNLAAYISNSLDSSQLGQGDKNSARLLAHYSVENAIKAAHADTSEFALRGATALEDIAAHRANFVAGTDVSGEYLKSLGDFLSGMIKDDASDEVKALHTRNVNNILDSEKLYATKNPINTMNLGKSKQKEFTEILEDINSVMVGEHSSKNLMDTEDIRTTVEAKTRRGYNEISKSVKENVHSNKKILGVGAGALVAAAIMSQKNPDFGGSTAESNPSAMTLRPAQMSQEQNSNAIRNLEEGLNMVGATDYILPSSNSKNSYQIDGKYSGKGDRNRSVRTSLFGDNGIDSARIETY